VDLLSLLAAASDPRWTAAAHGRARHVPLAVALVHAIRPARCIALPADGELQRACIAAAAALDLPRRPTGAVELAFAPALADLEALDWAPSAVAVAGDAVASAGWHDAGLAVAGVRVFLRGAAPPGLAPLLNAGDGAARILDALGGRADLRVAFNAQARDLAAERERCDRLAHSPGARVAAAYAAARERWLPSGTARRRTFSRVGNVVKGAVRGARARRSGPPEEPYARWMALHEPVIEAEDALDAILDPGLVVSFAVAGGSPAAVARTRGSLEAQTCGRWELSTGDTLAGALAQARGDLVVPLAAGDELAPRAVAALARRAADTGADVVYADEDRIEATGARAAPRFKPDWSPELLLGLDYLGAPVAYRAELVRAAGPWRDPWDLALRATERAAHVVHLPRVLVHRAETPPRDAEAERLALADAVHRRGLNATVEDGAAPGTWRVRRAIRGEPFVSMIVPTRDKVHLLRTTIESVEGQSTWRRFEFLVVDNGSVEPETIRYLEELRGRHRVIRHDAAFNWAAMNNLAAREARGDYLLFLNNDVDVIAPGWLEAMLEHAQQPDVGAVGAKLLYPDGRVQHAGVVLGIGGVAGHAFKLLGGDEPGYLGLASVTREVGAVTGACMMSSRAAFEVVGGFDERFRVAFNDVDYCIRLRERGLRVVYTPHALLHHHEQATRGALHPPEDEARLRTTWHAALALDPFYSPHLTHEREDFSVRR
jgi:GT2 family glycosyltransferase